MMIEKIYKKLKEKIDREPSKDDYSKLIAVYEKPEYLFQEVLDLEGIEFGIEIEFESEMSENDIIFLRLVVETKRKIIKNGIFVGNVVVIKMNL